MYWVYIFINKKTEQKSGTYTGIFRYLRKVGFNISQYFSKNCKINQKIGN